MTGSFWKILSASALILALFSCSKSSNNNTASCTVTYTDAQPLSLHQGVQYIASVSGTGGSISSIAYLDSAGTTTVKNPTLPWSKTVNLQMGSNPTLTAIGTANKGGEINISAFADGIQSGTSCDN